MAFRAYKTHQVLKPLKVELHALPATEEFTVGLEIELLIESKEKNHGTWFDCATDVKQILNSGGVQNHISGYGYQWTEDWKEWMVTEEYGITNEPENNRCKLAFFKINTNAKGMSINQIQGGIEIVSPKLNFGDHSAWFPDIDLAWLVLLENFNIHTSSQCSTQVHIAPSNDWTNKQLKDVAKSVVYFERSIDRLVPPHRQMNYWCRSNRFNGALKELSMKDVFNAVHDCDSRIKLEELLCALTFGSRTTVDRRFRWNFRNLTGTVEFRQPAGSASSEDGQTWIEFTVSFVQGALDAADGLDPLCTASLPDLKSMVFDGAARSGIKEFSRLEKLFDREKDDPVATFDCEKFILQEGMLDQCEEIIEDGEEEYW